MNKFKVGDVVHMNSGGPAMTVVAVPCESSRSEGESTIRLPAQMAANLAYTLRQGREYHCAWFTDKQRLGEAYFAEELLHAAKCDPGPPREVAPDRTQQGGGR